MVKMNVLFFFLEEDIINLNLQARLWDNATANNEQTVSSIVRESSGLLNRNSTRRGGMLVMMSVFFSSGTTPRIRLINGEDHWDPARMDFLWNHTIRSLGRYLKGRRASSPASDCAV